MGRRTVADTKAVEGHAAALRAAGARFQTGFLIGSVEEDRSLIAFLAPTPSTGGEGEASFASLKSSWIAEHWRQVSRMLPGGLTIVGLYAFAPLEESEPFTLQLRNALRVAATKRAPSDLMAENRELILLRICANSKQYIAKSLIVGAKVEEKPAELVFENVTSNCSFFTASFSTQHSLLIPGNELSLNTQLHENLAPLYKQILGSTVAKATSPGLTHQFFLPLGSERAPENCRHGVGKVDLFLSICAHAVLLIKAPSPAQIERALKEDAVQSIASRITVMCEELDRLAGLTPGQVNPLGTEKTSLPSVHTWPLPVRARIETKLRLYFSDYVVPGEQLRICAVCFAKIAQEVMERVSAMLGLQSADVLDITVLEPNELTLKLTLPAVPAAGSFGLGSAASVAQRSTKRDTSVTHQPSPSAPLVLFAVVILVFAVMAALMMRAR